MQLYCIAILLLLAVRICTSVLFIFFLYLEHATLLLHNFVYDNKVRSTGYVYLKGAYVDEECKLVQL